MARAQPLDLDGQGAVVRVEKALAAACNLGSVWLAAGSIERLAVKGCQWTQPRRVLPRIQPVSYTHLDVYKRQNLCRASARQRAALR